LGSFRVTPRTNSYPLVTRSPQTVRASRPMSVRQQEVTRKWTFDGSAPQGVAALRARMTDAGGEITNEADDSLSARIGSRMAMRIFGVLMPAGRGRIPMKIHINVRVATAERTEVTTTASSNPGWYLMSTLLGTDAYNMAPPQLLDYLQQREELGVLPSLSAVRVRCAPSKFGSPRRPWRT
jgi:hypothetical protein